MILWRRSRCRINRHRNELIHLGGTDGPRRIISLTRLHLIVLLLRGDLYAAELAAAVTFVVRRVAQAVLVAQVFLNVSVVFFHVFFFRAFEHAPAGLLRQPLQHFLSIMFFFWPAAASSSARISATTAAARPS